MNPALTVLWTLLALVVGAWLGLALPDIDQRTDTYLMVHRSIFTHGPLIPVGVFLVMRSTKHLSLRLFTICFCLGFVVHMAFDLFPSRWMGYALISPNPPKDGVQEAC